MHLLLSQPGLGLRWCMNSGPFGQGSEKAKAHRIEYPLRVCNLSLNQKRISRSVILTKRYCAIGGRRTPNKFEKVGTFRFVVKSINSSERRSTLQLSPFGRCCQIRSLPAVEAQPKPASSPTPQTSQLATTSGSCAADYYRNSDGICVHRPVKSRGSAVPQGATAQCRDGRYSVSQHSLGTCSHHGSVGRWL